jgi:Trm5-related predicted tRNA methylase
MICNDCIESCLLSNLNEAEEGLVHKGNYILSYVIGEGTIQESDEVKIKKAQERKLRREEKRYERFCDVKLKIAARRKQIKDRHIQQWAIMTSEERTNYKLEKKRRDDAREDRLKIAWNNGLNVCIDVSYENDHNDKELKSLWKQISLSYGVMRKSEHPLRLHITSLISESNTHMGLKSQGLDSWLIHQHFEKVWELFPISDIIVLSPDAEEAIEHFDMDKVMHNIRSVIVILI